MKVNFEANIGGGIILKTGFAVLYRIKDQAPAGINPGQSVNAAFSLDIDEPDTAYPYYGLEFTVYTFEKDGVSYDVSHDGIIMLAVFNPLSGNVIGINPSTTAAAGFAFAKLNVIPWFFFNLYGPANALRAAHGMKNNLVFDNGDVLPARGSEATVITRSPNGGETNGWGMLNFFCNVFYYYAIDPDVRTYLNNLTYVNGNMNFTNCMMSIIQSPFANVDEIYNYFISRPQVFAPSLTTMPTGWTMAVKFNDSGSGNFLIAGTAFAVFDKNGRAWVTNNFRQGTGNSGSHCMVFEHDGKPAPFSPLTGGGLLGTGFGAAVNSSKDTIALGNYGWGSTDYNPAAGSVSVFSCDGTAISPPNGYTECTSRVQGMAYDVDDNLWICSWGTQTPMAPGDNAAYSPPPLDDQMSSITVYPKGYGKDPKIKAVTFTDFDGESPFHCTFMVAFDSAGYAYVANAGNGANKIRSSVYKMQFKKTGDYQYALSMVTKWISDKDYPSTPYFAAVRGFENFRQISVSPAGYIYVGALMTDRIVVLNSDLKEQTEIKPDTMFAPWGVTIDNKGIMYICNFATGQGKGTYGITIMNLNDTSKSDFMTLPSGGSPVTLANGQPLYGNFPVPPCYDPLMKVTSTNIDAAGNLWAMNNWKPDVQIDVEGDPEVDLSANPGGDGVVVFLGVATPQ